MLHAIPAPLRCTTVPLHYPRHRFPSPQLSLLRKEIKEYRKSDTQYAAQLTSCRKKHEAEVEKTKELRRKLEAEVKRTTDLAKRDAVSVSVMSQLREQMKEELAGKAEEVEEKQVCAGTILQARSVPPPP